MGRAIVVHGGAGRHTLDSLDRKVDVAEQAAEAGWRIVSAGGSAVEAVEAATRILEDDPRFDAGVGSYLNEDGEVQLDAIIVDGQSLRFGAVAAVERVRHPVTLARHVMSDSPHALLVGRGAERFARRLGLTVPAVELITPETLEVWRRCHDDPSAIDATTGPGDTVGVVARDAAGHVAAATSTGGTKNKWVGRVGDSPIIGSGAWADDAAGAISCTGHGESIMRVCLAASAGERLRGGLTAMEVAEWAVRRLAERTEGLGGLIVLDAAGGVGWAWNTESMPSRGAPRPARVGEQRARDPVRRRSCVARRLRVSKPCSPCHHTTAVRRRNSAVLRRPGYGRRRALTPAAAGTLSTQNRRRSRQPGVALCPRLEVLECSASPSPPVSAPPWPWRRAP